MLFGHSEHLATKEVALVAVSKNFKNKADSVPEMQQELGGYLIN
jgi:hypothetical protein